MFVSLFAAANISKLSVTKDCHYGDLIWHPFWLPIAAGFANKDINTCHEQTCSFSFEAYNNTLSVVIALCIQTGKNKALSSVNNTLASENTFFGLSFMELQISKQMPKRKLKQGFSDKPPIRSLYNTAVFLYDYAT